MVLARVLVLTVIRAAVVKVAPATVEVAAVVRVQEGKDNV